MRGHAAHDNQSYVPKELFEQWGARDPIAYFEKHLLEKGVATLSEIAEVTARVEAGLDSDLAWAESQSAPEPDSALGDVFAGKKPTAIGTGRG